MDTFGALHKIRSFCYHLDTDHPFVPHMCQTVGRNISQLQVKNTIKSNLHTVFMIQWALGTTTDLILTAQMDRQM